ncbi:MAG: hypothetical protein P9X24_20055 [Candidatus Hatepunaea meridiana]|nr:hypothetical protein [Candidatus Hatepunaea meridiana]
MNDKTPFVQDQDMVDKKLFISDEDQVRLIKLFDEIAQVVHARDGMFLWNKSMSVNTEQNTLDSVVGKPTVGIHLNIKLR